MEIVINSNKQDSDIAVADLIAKQVKEKPNCVLGLATGSSPIGVYKELIRKHQEEGLDFSEVRTFNLDEYIGLDADHPQSYNFFMWDTLFNHLNIKKENVNLPSGVVDDIPAHCAEYENKIKELGGIDLQLLGIGSDGHIGFNEPTSSFTSRTRIKTLTQQTVKDNARFFEGDMNQVPRHCITMGIATILEAKTIALIATGENKAEAIRLSVEGPLTSFVPATALQLHADAKLYIDELAASTLSKKEYYNWVASSKPAWQK